MKAFQEALERDPDIFSHHGSYGTTVQQRGTTEPGLFYFLVAKTYARVRRRRALRALFEDGAR